MREVVYLGYSDSMLEELDRNPNYDLCLAVGVKKRISEKYYEYIRLNDIPYHEIANKVELLELFSEFSEAKTIIMYKFEYIIPMEMIGYHRIFNFHGGNLRTNRGAHAVVWSVLLRETETCLSAYELMGGIDEGRLVGEYHVDIGRDDSPAEVDNKLAKGLPYLLNCIHLYLDGNLKAQLITGGKYRRKIEKCDYTIDSENDSVDVIRGKVLSQKPYSGAVINYDNREYRVHDYKISEYKTATRNILKTIKGFEIQTEEGAILLW